LPLNFEGTGTLQRNRADDTHGFCWHLTPGPPGQPGTPAGYPFNGDMSA